MTEKKTQRLSLLILGDLAISAAATLLFYLVAVFVSIHIVDSYIYNLNIELSDIELDYYISWIYSVGLLVAAVFFVVLFLILLGKRLSYVSKLTRGIEALRLGEIHSVEEQGNDELTALARAVNYLSETQRRVLSEEKALQKEKEEFLRTLSHDIRTPLTSIMSYSEYILSSDLSKSEIDPYLELIRKKSEQIKTLASRMLDGDLREVEHFDNAKMLFLQLAEGFEEMLDEGIKLKSDIDLPDFSGDFDVRELQRIFDNLASNINKYADRDDPVSFEMKLENGILILKQKNAVKTTDSTAESYGIGIVSIRRTAKLYGGTAEVENKGDFFSITVKLTDF